MVKLYEKGLEKYPFSGVLIGNFFMLLWIFIGAISSWFLNPFLAVVFLILALIMVYVVLRKLVCTNCYYYGKRCGIGWGMLSALMFKKGDINKFGKGTGMKLAPMVYVGLFMILPIIFIVTSMFLNPTFLVQKIIVLILILVLSFYSGVISRQKSCAVCKMRLICPGAAVRKK